MLPLYIMLSHDVNTFGKCFKLFRKSLVNKTKFSIFLPQLKQLF